MRLAFIHPSFAQHGGAENHLIAAMQGLAERGHTVDLFTDAYDETCHLPLHQARYRVHVLAGRGFMEGIGGTLRKIRQLTPLLRDQYDLLLPANFPANVWVALGNHRGRVVWMCMEPKRNLYPQVMYREAPGFAAHGYRTRHDYPGLHGLFTLLRHDPHVLLPYGIRTGLQRALDHLAARRTDHILVNSPYTAEKTSEIYHHNFVHVAWAGVDLPAVSAATQPVILIPTRLEAIKNVAPVLHALHLLRNRDQLGGYTVEIVGKGGEESALKRLAGELELDDIVKFRGFIPNTGRDLAYARCAFVVYPSLAEPLGLPCAEAALHEKAVIASFQGGPAAIIADGVSGLLVDTTQPEALAGAIARLIADPALTERMGQAGRARVEPLMALPNWIEQLERLLESFIDADSSTPVPPAARSLPR